MPSILNHVLGGWETAGTVIWMSGRPFTVYSGINTVSNVVQSTADCNGCSRNSGQLVLESGRNFSFDTATRSQFAAPVPGSIGNTGRNFARNVLNNPSFDNPTAVITSTIFGRINDSVTNNARRIQLSGKLSF